MKAKPALFYLKKSIKKLVWTEIPTAFFLEILWVLNPAGEFAFYVLQSQVNS